MSRKRKTFYVRVHRTGELVDVYGECKRLDDMGSYLRLEAPDGTVQRIPWAVITRVASNPDVQP